MVFGSDDDCMTATLYMFRQILMDTCLFLQVCFSMVFRALLVLMPNIFPCPHVQFSVCWASNPTPTLHA